MENYTDKNADTEPIKSAEFAKIASNLAKAELDKEVEFFTLPQNEATKFHIMPKNSISGIFAKAKLGKSLFLVDIAQHLLATKQVKQVIYYDVDNNYTTLKKRNQSDFIENNENFLLFTDEKVLELAQIELEKIKSYIYQAKESRLAELDTKAKSLETLINKGDFLALFTYLLSDNSFNLNNTAIFFDSLNGFIPKISDNMEVKKVFLRVFRPLTRKGAHIFYLAHTTKSKKDDGTSEYQGAQSLEACSDYFCELERVDESVFSVIVKANRHTNALNYSVERYEQNQAHSRLKKIDYIEQTAPSENQLKARNLILDFLASQADKKAQRKFIWQHLQSQNISVNVFNVALKALYEQGKISHIGINKNSFYALPTQIATSQPKVIEFTG